MSVVQVPGPLVFEPLFFERIWGGRRLEALYGKRLPRGKPIGESWEIVDRPETQCVVREGQWRGRSLHDLWANERDPVFGALPDTPRFPLLIKLLDCRERLSLQVHPPAEAARAQGGEPKTECWYVAHADPGAELYLGWEKRCSPDEFRRALTEGTAEQLIHRLSIHPGEAFFIPSGRVHAIGGGSVIVEVQQNSDTTFRVFDWNRRDNCGNARTLHIEEALGCINFDDPVPSALTPDGERIVKCEHFAIEKWDLDEHPRELSPRGSFAIACCLSGSLRCGRMLVKPGEFVLLPAQAEERLIAAAAPASSMLRITIP